MFNDILKNLSQLIKFNSSKGEPEEGAPFGSGAKKALDYFLSLAEFLGFKTKNYDGYAGEVVFGTGKDFAILAHLDVVPAGSGWTHEPFGGEIDYENKRVWGRGAMDDKGPAICVLYAMKALLDEGFKPKRRIKLIVGCNEESGWECIKYYKAHAVMPEEGFSPDADFPVIYAEKGILHIKLKFREDCSFTGLKGGEYANMVCDRCEVMAPLNLDKAANLHLLTEGGKLISVGKSAHGSTPDEGVNAIEPILEYLGLDVIKDALFGKCFGLKELHDETGYLTFSPNVIEQNGDGICVTCDIRYPATMKKEDILKPIKESGVEFEIVSEQAPLYNDKNCFLIKTLCGVYNEVTGKAVQPVAIGGGTYARALKCGAAFGPEEAGEEQTIHKANEYITFDKIEKCFKIYKLAIERLTK
ncbi:MAG: Sapep family Mn(2+)-dependent dipeptidase [Clostridia bacterium]|nr:Sapep family Mn(2+)-dependent dipeptidase [Clostridia bacterium]